MPRVVVLDACVLYSAALRDLLLRLSRAGFFSLRWSDRILDEMVLALTRTRPDIPVQRLDRLKAIMIEAFPRAMVEPAAFAPLGLPDPADEHVVAVAAASSADLLVTHNLRDFPAQTVKRATSVRVMSPDELLVMLLAEDEEAVRCVLDEMAAGLRNPPIPPERLIEGLQAQAPRFAEAYGRVRA